MHEANVAERVSGCRQGDRKEKILSKEEDAALKLAKQQTERVGNGNSVLRRRER